MIKLQTAKLTEMQLTAPDWRRSQHEVIAMLAIRNARAGMAGRACPIAARVLERLRATNAA